MEENRMCACDMCLGVTSVTSVTPKCLKHSLVTLVTLVTVVIINYNTVFSEHYKNLLMARKGFSVTSVTSVTSKKVIIYRRVGGPSSQGWQGLTFLKGCPELWVLMGLQDKTNKGQILRWASIAGLVPAVKLSMSSQRQGVAC